MKHETSENRRRLSPWVSSVSPSPPNLADESRHIAAVWSRSNVWQSHSWKGLLPFRNADLDLAIVWRAVEHALWLRWGEAGAGGGFDYQRAGGAPSSNRFSWCTETSDTKLLNVSALTFGTEIIQLFTEYVLFSLCLGQIWCLLSSKHKCLPDCLVTVIINTLITIQFTHFPFFCPLLRPFPPLHVHTWLISACTAPASHHLVTPGVVSC